MMWEIEEVKRAGTTILIFYKMDPEAVEGVDKTLFVRGQIVCYDQQEIELWQTLLQTLNSPKE